MLYNDKRYSNNDQPQFDNESSVPTESNQFLENIMGPNNNMMSYLADSMILYENSEFNDYHHSIDTPIDKDLFMVPLSELPEGTSLLKSENAYVETELKRLNILQEESTVDEQKEEA